eukprot:TRINITY_DN88043_c0_g1_i1.p1 TRINITY_DN88043_c0_g1~~TRINITY_DN88043_c0_g1_i1.p1  ORF type:complete len:505 (-),score=80.14 TRINITY_DN88043_c0_g1_i1:85-1599(-)
MAVKYVVIMSICAQSVNFPRIYLPRIDINIIMKQIREEDKGASNYSTKGWHWGNFVMGEEKLGFKVAEKPCFSIPFSDIANANITKDEVTIEFHQDDTAKESAKRDMVCELRFFVPNAGAKKEEKADEEAKGEGPTADAEKSQAQQLYQQLVKKANIGAFAGEAIVSLHDLPLITPRGKYSLDMYHTFLKFHGRTHNFKVLYRNINRAFVLPKPDGQHIGFVIALSTPIKQGQTYYPFIVLQFHKDTISEVKPNLSPEQLKEHFGGKLEGEIEGPLYDVLSKVFTAMIGIKIIVPSGFKSAKDTPAIRCSVRAFEGHLYPLEKSLIFVNKPVVYIRLADIQFVEFARVSQSAAQPNRSFDFNVVTKSGETFQFTGMDRNEYAPLVQYIQLKKVTIRNVEPAAPASKVIKEQLVKPFNVKAKQGKLEEDESEDEDYKAPEVNTCAISIIQGDEDEDEESYREGEEDEDEDEEDYEEEEEVEKKMKKAKKGSKESKPVKKQLFGCQ